MMEETSRYDHSRAFYEADNFQPTRTNNAHTLSNIKTSLYIQRNVIVQAVCMGHVAAYDFSPTRHSVPAENGFSGDNNGK